LPSPNEPEAPETAPAEPSVKAADPGEAEPRAAAPKRKKKKKRVGAAREGLPPFTRDYPRDAALDALLAAFEAGNYAVVRRDAPALAESTEKDDVRWAARDLLRRIQPDPIILYLLAIAAGLLVVLAVWYWSHPHGAS
jgi:hypothetical protein